MPAEPTQTAKPLSAPQKALRKMGLVRDVDLALHLPYRYEDETRLVKLADAREGDVVQFEATVRSCEVVFKPRRQLLAVVEDEGETCTLRFFNFYPNMQKALQEGRHVRLRGEVRGGFMGRTCMHPSVQAAGGDLSTALTPVYPSTATMPQAYLRKAVQSGLAHVLRRARPPRFYLNLHRLAASGAWAGRGPGPGQFLPPPFAGPGSTQRARQTSKHATPHCGRLIGAAVGLATPPARAWTAIATTAAPTVLRP